MKTLRQAKTMLENILNFPPLDKKNRKKAEREAAILSIVVKYLETSPRKEFVRSELQRVSGIIEKIDSGFNLWMESYIPIDGRKPIDIYRKECDRSRYVRQKKMLKFILEVD